MTPTLSGYIFSPTSASVPVNGASVTGVNFTASAHRPCYDRRHRAQIGQQHGTNVNYEFGYSPKELRGEHYRDPLLEGSAGDRHGYREHLVATVTLDFRGLHQRNRVGLAVADSREPTCDYGQHNLRSERQYGETPTT